MTARSTDPMSSPAAAPAPDAGRRLLLTLASAPPAAAADAAGGVRPGLHRPDGRRRDASRAGSASSAPKGELTLVTVDGPERVIPLDSLVKLSREVKRTREEDPASQTRRPGVVLFPDGDRLFRASILSAERDDPGSQARQHGPASPSRSKACSAWSSATRRTPSPRPADRPRRARRPGQRVRAEPRTSEVVWLNNGDKLTGGFLGLTDKTVEFQPAKDRVALDLAGRRRAGVRPVARRLPEAGGPVPGADLRERLAAGRRRRPGRGGARLARTRFGAADQACRSPI